VGTWPWGVLMKPALALPSVVMRSNRKEDIIQDSNNFSIDIQDPKSNIQKSSYPLLTLKINMNPHILNSEKYQITLFFNNLVLGSWTLVLGSTEWWSIR
jgi:hypothetical protein